MCFSSDLKKGPHNVHIVTHGLLIQTNYTKQQNYFHGALHIFAVTLDQPRMAHANLGGSI